jgi:hypothetical protein
MLIRRNRSCVIDYLHKRFGIVAHYYYRFEAAHASYNEISWVLRRLIRQIVSQHRCYTELQALYSQNRRECADRIAVDEWRRLLFDVCRSSGPVFFVFDGLDVPSAEDRADLIRHFLKQLPPFGVQVFVTSRPVYISSTADVSGRLVVDLSAPAQGMADFTEMLLKKKMPEWPQVLTRKGYDPSKLAHIIADATSCSMSVYVSVFQ